MTLTSTLPKAGREAAIELAKRARVLIVDDHAVVRAGLSSLIAQEPDLMVCGEADNAPAALAALAQAQPDLVVVDLSLDRGHGLELIKQLKAAHPEIRVVVFSMHDEEIYGERCLQAGAEAYVEKRQRPEMVIRAIRVVLEGKLFMGREVTDRLLRRSLGGSRERRGAESLSDRELEVVELLGRGLSTRDIAERLHLSRKTVDAHCENLKRKLNLKTSRELLRFCILRAQGESPTAD